MLDETAGWVHLWAPTGAGACGGSADAGAGQIKQLMVRQGLMPVAAGLAIGLLGAQFAGRLIEAQLFEHNPGRQ